MLSEPADLINIFCSWRGATFADVCPAVRDEEEAGPAQMRPLPGSSTWPAGVQMADAERASEGGGMWGRGVSGSSSGAVF